MQTNRNKGNKNNIGKQDKEKQIYTHKKQRKANKDESNTNINI